MCKGAAEQIRGNWYRVRVGPLAAAGITMTAAMQPQWSRSAFPYQSYQTELQNVNISVKMPAIKPARGINIPSKSDAASITQITRSQS